MPKIHIPIPTTNTWLLFCGVSIIKNEPINPRNAVRTPDVRYSTTSLKNFASLKIKKIVRIDDTTTIRVCRLGSRYPEKSKIPRPAPISLAVPPTPIAVENEIPVSAENTRIFGNPKSFHIIVVRGRNKIL